MRFLLYLLLLGSAATVQGENIRTNKVSLGFDDFSSSRSSEVSSQQDSPEASSEQQQLSTINRYRPTTYEYATHLEKEQQRDEILRRELKKQRKILRKKMRAQLKEQRRLERIEQEKKEQVNEEKQRERERDEEERRQLIQRQNELRRELARQEVERAQAKQEAEQRSKQEKEMEKAREQQEFERRQIEEEMKKIAKEREEIERERERIIEARKKLEKQLKEREKMRRVMEEEQTKKEAAKKKKIKKRIEEQMRSRPLPERISESIDDVPEEVYQQKKTLAPLKIIEMTTVEPSRTTVYHRKPVIIRRRLITRPNYMMMNTLAPISNMEITTPLPTGQFLNVQPLASPSTTDEAVNAQYMKAYYQQYYKEWYRKHNTAPESNTPPPYVPYINGIVPASTVTDTPQVPSPAASSIPSPVASPSANFYGIKDPRNSGQQDISKEQLDKMCVDIKNATRVFGIRNAKQFAEKNCGLIRMYFPAVTCDQIIHVMEYCQPVLSFLL